MSLEEALVTFINEAKLAADQDSKLYALNQIREIVLHRSPELRDRGLQELAEFQVERAAQIRRFLINLYSDVCEREPRYAPITVNVFDYFSYDSNDNLIRDLVNATVKLFPTMMRLFQHPQEQGMQEVWEKWHQLLLRMIGCIDSDKGPQARKAAIRLLEVYTMFALSDQIESVAPADRSGSHGVNISKFAPDHPFVRSAEVTNEAEEALGRLLLWIQRGGTKTRAFDHGLYAQSIEVVCSVALRRPAMFAQIVNVLTHFMETKQDLQPQIKEGAARTVVRLVIAAERTALQQDIEASFAGQKLEAALASQGFGAIISSARQAAGPQTRHIVEAQDPRKRKRDAAPQPAPEAIDSKKVREEVASATPAAAAGAAPSASAEAQAAMRASAAPQPQEKLGEVVLHANDWQVKPLEVDAFTCRTAGRAALLRFLGSMPTAQQLGFGEKFCDWSIKMAMTMASLESTSEQGFSTAMPLRLASRKPVSDFLEMKETEQTAENKFLADKLQLPSSLVDAADFCIDTVARNEMQGEVEGSLSNVSQIALDLLTKLFAKIDSGAEGERAEDVYDSLLAHTLIKLRTIASIPAEVGATLLCRLPRVPRDAIALFKVSALSDNKRAREWGMKLLRDLAVFCEDVSQPCLNALLWFATHSDFEVRIKSVHTCHELCEEEPALQEHTFTFALYVVMSVVGTKLLEWRRQMLGDRIAQMAEHDSVEPTAEHSAENASAAAEGGESAVETAPLKDQGEEQPMAIATDENGQQAEQHHDGAVVDGEAAVSPPPYTYSLYNPANMEGYAGGAETFEGDFLAEGVYEATGGVEIESDADVKRRIQLICNLALLEPRMIVALRDASGAVQASVDAMTDELAPAAAGSNDVWSKGKVENAEGFLERQRAIVHAMNSEVQNIAPAVARSLGAVRLFTILKNGDPAARSLLLTVLRSLTVDEHVPPPQDLVNAVLEFVRSNAPNLDSLLVPIVGGFSAAMVEEFLPRLISLGAEATEEFVRRLTRVRPPPISRAGILCALHRIDHESQNVKLKAVREAIELCLQNRNDFRSEVIREALETMSQDPVPPLMLMRTVILACQAYPELKRVALRTVLPRLLDRKIWDTSPKLWEGFVVCVKQLASHRDAGDLLRDLLRIPFETLRNLVKVATTVEEPLARIVSRMSDREMEEAVSPRPPQEGEAAASTGEAETDMNEIRDTVSKIRKLLGSDSKSRAR